MTAKHRRLRVVEGQCRVDALVKLLTRSDWYFRHIGDEDPRGQPALHVSLLSRCERLNPRAATHLASESRCHSFLRSIEADLCLAIAGISRAVKFHSNTTFPVREVTNWQDYEASLRNRGSLTVWFTEEALAHWRAQPRKTRGGQPHYPDLATETALTLRTVFRLALRQGYRFNNAAAGTRPASSRSHDAQLVDIRIGGSNAPANGTGRPSR